MSEIDRSQQEIGTAAFRSPRQRRVLRWTVSAVAIAAIAVGGVGIAAATTTTAPSQVWTTPGTGGGPFGRGHGGFGGPGGAGAFGAFGGGPAAGAPSSGGQKVTAVNGSSITVAGANGKSTTYQTTSSTNYTVDGIPASASAVHVGDRVSIRVPFSGGRFKGPNSSTTTTTTTATPATATSINVVLPELSGTVHSVGSGEFVLVDSQGFWRTVHTSNGTTYLQSGVGATESALTVGAQVEAAGTVDSDHTSLDASRVNVILPTVSGQVTAIAGSSIIISTFSGTSATVTTSSATHFTSGGASGSFGDVKVGDRVTASGTKASNGNINAVKVSVLPNGKTVQPGAHPSFPGGGPPPGAPLSSS